MIFNNGDILIITSDIKIADGNYVIESGKYKVVNTWGGVSAKNREHGYNPSQTIYHIKCESGRGVFTISEPECVENNVVTVRERRESILDKLL